MLAARFHDSAEELSLEEVDRPTIGPDEVLVDLKSASFCGSDLNYLGGKTDPGNVPLTLGHEGAGTVVETGIAVSHVREGDRVVIHYIESCGQCKPCLNGYDNRCRNRQSIGHHVDGTFAEFIGVPERCAIQIPDSVPFEQASVAGCAASTAYHAINCGGISAADNVAIFGIGGVGLHAVLWADFLGANTTIAVDIKQPQLDAARDYGADVTLNPEEDAVVDRIQEEMNGWGVDISLECSGSPVAMDQAIASLGTDHGYETGTAVSVGIQTENFDLGYGDIREGALRVSGDHTRAELNHVMSLMGSGEIDISDSITHEIALKEINSASSILSDNGQCVGRVAVDTR
jgi:2-desacetyl-2-hydroxyethyl bacteriochlorophyllide A dehydrogenase